jgi:hypothetical protein
MSVTSYTSVLQAGYESYIIAVSSVSCKAYI